MKNNLETSSDRLISIRESYMDSQIDGQLDKYSQIDIQKNNYESWKDKLIGKLIQKLHKIDRQIDIINRQIDIINRQIDRQKDDYESWKDKLIGKLIKNFFVLN